MTPAFPYCCREVARIQNKLGATMIYVAHDQTEAMTLGDRIAILRLGVLQRVASPEELYLRPANPFMAGTLENGSLRTPLGDVPLTGRLGQTLEASGPGREVIVGIRPSNIHVFDPGTGRNLYMADGAGQSSNPGQPASVQSAT